MDYSRLGLKTDGVFYSIYLTNDLVILLPRAEFGLKYTFTFIDVYNEDDVDLLV